MELKFKEDEELQALVAEFIVARENDAEIFPLDNGDFTEGGLTDFDYVGQDLEPHEYIQIGMNIAQEANGREIWYTKDGVGFRIFFGPLEEIKERVKRQMTILAVHAS